MRTSLSMPAPALPLTKQGTQSFPNANTQLPGTAKHCGHSAGVPLQSANSFWQGLSEQCLPHSRCSINTFWGEKMIAINLLFGHDPALVT